MTIQPRFYRPLIVTEYPNSLVSEKKSYGYVLRISSTDSIHTTKTQRKRYLPKQRLYVYTKSSVYAKKLCQKIPRPEYHSRFLSQTKPPPLPSLPNFPQTTSSLFYLLKTFYALRAPHLSFAAYSRLFQHQVCILEICMRYEL